MAWTAAPALLSSARMRSSRGLVDCIMWVTSSGSHGDRHARTQHDIGGVRIDIDVEFGGGRDVAHLEIAAAHHHDLLDARDDARLLDHAPWRHW